MSRVQLALNVANLDAAVEFYSKLFDTTPHKRRDGYANFAIDQPPLKLVLIESSAPSGSINHLGVEVSSADEVTAATRRLAAQDLDTEVEENVDCCFAVQDKVWVDGVDGTKWEIYTILDDNGGAAPGTALASGDCGAGSCGCAVDASPATVAAG